MSTPVHFVHLADAGVEVSLPGRPRCDCPVYGAIRCSAPLEMGDLICLVGHPSESLYRVERIEDGSAIVSYCRIGEARRIDRDYAPPTEKEQP